MCGDVASILLFLSLIGVCLTDGLKVDSRTYVTSDGVVTADVAFVSEVTIPGKDERHNIFFADKRGHQIPAIMAIEKPVFQFSWVEDAEEISTGEHGIKVYNDEEFAALKKAQRNSEDISGIPYQFFVSLYHGGTYYGPWLSTEFVAAFSSVVLWYIAFSARSNLMSS